MHLGHRHADRHRADLPRSDRGHRSRRGCRGAPGRRSERPDGRPDRRLGGRDGRRSRAGHRQPSGPGRPARRRGPASSRASAGRSRRPTARPALPRPCTACCRPAPRSSWVISGGPLASSAGTVIGPVGGGGADENGHQAELFSNASASTADHALAFNIPVRCPALDYLGRAGLKAEYGEPGSRRSDGGLAGGWQCAVASKTIWRSLTIRGGGSPNASREARARLGATTLLLGHHYHATR